MQYKKIKLTDDIESDLGIRVEETIEGHRYAIRNRHTEGFEDLNFLRFLTYQQMLDNNIPSEIVEDIVPIDERNCDNCKYYIVSEGVFTQDVIHALILRMQYQYKWLKNGFYRDGIDALNKAKYQYELFTLMRKRYGFYHIPFTIENFIENLSKKTNDEIEMDRDLINTFFEIEVSNRNWKTKEELIKLIK